MPEEPQGGLMSSSAAEWQQTRADQRGGQELWNTVKKLRPGLPKALSQLVLKALTIGVCQINCKRPWCSVKLLTKADEVPEKKAPRPDLSSKQEKPPADQHQYRTSWS